VRKILIGSTLLAGLLAGPALAADIVPRPLPPPPVRVAIFTWTGFYIGGNVGAHWGTDKLTTAPDPVGWTAAAANELNDRSAVSLHPKGVIGGIQGGFNWQINSIVLGFEADANWTGGSASRTLPFTGAVNIANGDIMTDATKETFLSTVRGRLGVAVGDVLVYGTGGLAVGTLKVGDTFCFCWAAPPTLAAVAATSTRTGWTAGGGLEWRMWGGWTMKAEYLHVSLGTLSTSIPSCAACGRGFDITVNHKYSDDIARVGINYLFGGGPVVAGY